MNIIVKRYEHYNHALGKYISSKREYDYEMKKGGYVPYEEGQELAKKFKDKQYIPSERGLETVKHILSHGDKNGKITLSQHERLAKAMLDTGVKFETPDWCPKHYTEGGYATDER